MPDPGAVPTRGFAAAVSRVDGRADRSVPATISVGKVGAGEEARWTIALTHADGTVLTALLSADQLERLAELLEATVDAELAAGATLQ